MKRLYLFECFKSTVYKFLMMALRFRPLRRTLCMYFLLKNLNSISEALKAATPEEVKTLLCIGDSITQGSGSSEQFYDYPSQLSRLLNADISYNGIHYDVINLGKNCQLLKCNATLRNSDSYLGISGATAQKNQEQSYWNSPQFARASQYSNNASGVVILLGTNDTKVRAWNESLFYADYSSLVNHFKGFKSR